MFHFKSQQTLFVCCTLLFLTSACTGVSFSPAPVSCESGEASAKAGLVPGPVILFPNADSVVGGKVNVSGTCADGKPVQIEEISGNKVEAQCKNGLFTAEMILSSGDGSKDLMVSQKSAADGSNVVDRLCFMKDTVPPAVTINNGNSAQGTNTNTTTVTGTCEAGLTVILTGPGLTTPIATDCNGGSFTATVTVNTGDGIKNIVGTQIDRAGNQGAAATDVNVDTSAPIIKITSAIPAVTKESKITVSGICENGLPVEIGALRATTAPAVSCTNGNFTATIPLPGPDGQVSAQVFQVDLAGNIGFDAKTLIKDTTPPAPTIALPLANAYLPSSSTFSGTCEAGASVVLSGSVLNAPQTVACNSGQWTLTANIASGQGAKTLIASQTDAAGNEGQGQRSFLVDTVAPVLAFTAPAANSFVAATFTVIGTCESGLNVNLSGTGITAAASAPCVSGAFSASVKASAGDGSKLVVATQTDAAGNTGTANRTFLRDTTGPLLTIVSPADGSRVGATITMTGACESGLTINFTGAGLANNASTVCAGTNTYSVALTISAGDGTKAISAREVDASGNDAVANVNYLRDTTAPLVKITSPVANTVAQTGLTVGGTCEAGLNVTLNGAGVATAVVTPCAAPGVFVAAINFTAGEGAKLVVATQTDLSGNVGTDSRSFISDLSGPDVKITLPVANSYLPTNFTVQGTCETGFAVTVAGAGVAAPMTSNCAAGTYSANVTVSAGDGAKIVTASQKDGVGNTATDTKNYLRDTVAPTVTIASPANGTTAKNGVLLTGACESGLEVQISGAGVAATTTTACANNKYESNITFSANDGAKEVIVSQTDAAGNKGQVQGNFNRDTTPPLVAITSPAADTAAQNGLTVGGTCETGLNVTLNGAGVATAVVTPCAAPGTFSANIVFSDGNGAKLVTASQTDAVGNTGSGSRTFQRDLTPPSIAINSPAAGTYLATNFTVLGTCEMGMPVTVAGAGVNAAVTTACNAGTFSAAVVVSAGDGNKVVTASQKDAVGNTATDTKNYLRDTSAPVITITAPANGTTAQNGVMLVGACETGLTVQIEGAGVKNAATANCANGQYQSNILFSDADGAKAVSVSQTDAAGNKGQAQGNYNRDTTAPVVAITSPNANTEGKKGLTVGGICETGLTVTLNGAGVATAVTTPCNAGAFSAAILFTDGNGAKLVTANQTDAVGNTGSGSRTFLRDETPPTILITAPAANSYLPTNFAVQGNCEVGLQVSLSGAGLATAATAACTGGTFAANVTVSAGDGAKNIIASQTDGVGNTAMDSKNYLRDTSAPVITIAAPANGSVAKNGVTLSGACESGLVVQISGAGVASDTTTACANSKYESAILFSNGDGAKAVTVSQTDAAGNKGQANGNFMRDTTPPAVAITSPAENTVGQNGLTVGGTCEAGLNVTLNGAGVATAVVTPCAAGGTFSSSIVFSDGAGAKLVTANQTDAVGNTGSGSRTFQRDLTPPSIAISLPAANSYLPTNFAVQGTCETGFAVTVAGAGIATPVNANCAAGAFTANVTVSAGDGAKAITASQTDAVGNTATDTKNYLRDTLAPVITITSPANGTVAKNGVTLAGACESGLAVQISGAGVASATTTACANGKYESAILYSNGDGAKGVTVSQTDAAGNMGQAAGNFVRDTMPPLVAITSPDASTSAKNAILIGGTCEPALDVTLNGAGVATPVTVTCMGGVFTANIALSNGDGPKVVTANQTDAVGNTGSGSRTFNRDLTPPTITITAPAANSYLPATFAVQGACETGLSVVLGGSGIAAAATVNCVGGAYTANVNVSNGEGAKTITATQTDAVGNTATATQNYLRDTMAPVITITAPANGTIAKNGVTLTGACETGLTVQISGAGMAAAATAACNNGQYQSAITFSNGDGAKAVNVSQTDGAGNKGQANGNYLRDTTAPVVAITTPAANSEAQNGLSIGGNCEAGLNVTLNGAGVATPVVVACTNSGVFAADIVFSNGAGVKTVTASQTDALGNTGSDSRSFVRDLSAPTVTITVPTANSYLLDSFVVQGACETGLQVAVAGTGLAAPVTVNCPAGSYTAPVNVSSGDGVKNITAKQTDASGNVGQASQNFLRDTTAPALAITAPANGSSVLPSVALVGTCETGLTVSVSGDITATTGACNNGGFNINITFTAALGTKNVKVQQTDAAGNVGQANSQFLRDSDAGSEMFISDASFGKIDILFIDDNSASMDPNQASLGTKFAGFAAELLKIDWQIGITTTDCSAGAYGICGSLLSLTGANSKILTPNTANYQTVFNNSIQRPETAGCLAKGTCPAGNSQPLLSATTAMNKHNTDNNGFFRSNADLAIVILSDADEGQTGNGMYNGRPAQLVSTFNSIWPTDKKLKVYSIIVKPGDTACHAQMNAGSAGFSFYGNLVDQTVNLTAGLSTSICAPDYSVTLKSIGESVRTLTNSVELKKTPIAGSVSVQFTPNQNITYKVIGNRVVFDSPPSVGTQINVSYRY